jgi:hypothetical protein
LSAEVAALGVGVARTILAVPGAIKDLKALMRGVPEPSAAVGQIQRLQVSISEFCSEHVWLREAKELHDCLTTLDHMLESVFRETARSTAAGRFDPEAFSVPEVRRSWNAAKLYSLSKLLSFSEGIRAICPAPLQRDSAGAFLSGPAWAKRMIELGRQIDDLFKQYDHGDPDTKPQLFDAMDCFISLVKTELVRANERIRDEAARLADALNELHGALQGV